MIRCWREQWAVGWSSWRACPACSFGLRLAALAQALLTAAGAFAAALDLGLVLDVIDDALPAISLYERLGWQLVGRRPASWTTDDGHRPLLRVYVRS